MALTKLNALGSAIRAKVGETEKKTLPELTEIVEDELLKPTGTKTIAENGTEIDVAQYAKAIVNVPDTGKNGLYLALLFNEATQFIDDSIEYVVRSMFEGKTSLVRISLPNAQFEEPSASYFAHNCTNLKIADIPNVALQGSTGGGNRVFSGCNNLVYARFKIGGDTYSVFESCTSLVTVNVMRYTHQYIYQSLNLHYSSTFSTFILNERVLVPLNLISVFNASCPIMVGTGSVYVPDFDENGNDLPSQYKAATNWVDLPEGTIKGYSESPAFVAVTHTIGDCCQMNGHFYTYASITNTDNEPSGTTEDNDWWHYVGECEAI